MTQKGNGSDAKLAKHKCLKLKASSKRSLKNHNSLLSKRATPKLTSPTRASQATAKKCFWLNSMENLSRKIYSCRHKEIWMMTLKRLSGQVSQSTTYKSGQKNAIVGSRKHWNKRSKKKLVKSVLCTHRIKFIPLKCWVSQAQVSLSMN